MSTTPDFGDSLSCIYDLDPTFFVVSGFTALGQAIARRLLTPRGQLIDDPNYGYDLSQFIDADVGPYDLPRIQTFAQQEVLKDERILSATVTMTLNSGNLLIQVNLVSNAGPFQLTLNVSNVTAPLLQVITS